MMLSAFDLNLVLVLHTVLAEQSVARAARKLHLTPSAISNSLSRLRLALADPLVTRKGRGIVPTPRAMELMPALARALAEIEQAITQVPFDSATCTRTFTLAMADAGQVAWLPRVVAAIDGAMPRALLRIIGIDSLVALGDLGSTEVDLHLGVKATGPGIHSEPLFEEPLVLVSRKGNRLCAGRLSPARLSALRHVAVELAPGRGFRDVQSQAYARVGIERTVALRVPTFAAAAAVTSATMLVTTLPASFLAAQGKRFGLVPVQGAVPRHAVTMSLCWHERTHTDPGQLALRSLVRRALTSRE